MSMSIDMAVTVAGLGAKDEAQCYLAIEALKAYRMEVERMILALEHDKTYIAPTS